MYQITVRALCISTRTRRAPNNACLTRAAEYVAGPNVATDHLDASWSLATDKVFHNPDDRFGGESSCAAVPRRSRKNTKVRAQSCAVRMREKLCLLSPAQLSAAGTHMHSSQCICKRKNLHCAQTPWKRHTHRLREVANHRPFCDIGERPPLLSEIMTRPRSFLVYIAEIPLSVAK